MHKYDTKTKKRSPFITHAPHCAWVMMILRGRAFSTPELVENAGSRCSSRPCGSHCCLWRSHLNYFITCFCLVWHVSNLSWLCCCCLIPIVQTINDTTTIFIFIQCHDVILNSNILSFTQCATDFNLAVELRINKIEGEELILSVSFLSDAFTLLLHLPKKKGAPSSRDGWYPGLITTNAY